MLQRHFAKSDEVDSGQFARRSVLLPVLMAVGLTGCIKSRTATQHPLAPSIKDMAADMAADSDAISGLSVSMPTETLRRGAPVRLRVHLQYSLVSFDQGFLSLRFHQFANTASCIPEPAIRDTLFDASDAGVTLVPIEKGTHTLQLDVVWPGDTGESTHGEIFGAGTLSFEASLWSRTPRYRFLIRNFGTEYCVRF